MAIGRRPQFLTMWAPPWAAWASLQHGSWFPWSEPGGSCSVFCGKGSEAAVVSTVSYQLPSSGPFIHVGASTCVHGCQGRGPWGPWWRLAVTPSFFIITIY